MKHLFDSIKFQLEREGIPFQNWILGLMVYLLSIFFLSFVMAASDTQAGLKFGGPKELVPPVLFEISPAETVVPDSVEEPSGLYSIGRSRPGTLDKIDSILGDFRTGLPVLKKKKLAQLIYKESLRYEYAPELILALIVTESSFYNWARSHVGAIGLMQIMPTTGISLAKATNIDWNGKDTLFDPSLNIKLGMKYLAMLHDQFGDLEIALTAYNHGPTRVQEMLGRCDRLPRTYVQKVLSTFQRFQQLGPRDLLES
jgi:hypothetical protein